MENIQRAELCEKKMYYPVKLSKQEKETGRILNVSQLLYSPTGLSWPTPESTYCGL